MNNTIYVIFDNISLKPVDVFFANTQDEAIQRLENQLINIEKRLGNKFKYDFEIYQVSAFQPKTSKSVKHLKRR